MTELLDKAFQSTSALPPEKQDELARLVLDQIDDAPWDRLLDEPRSQSFLERLAVEAKAEIAAGLAMDSDPATGLK